MNEKWQWCKNISIEPLTKVSEFSSKSSSQLEDINNLYSEIPQSRKYTYIHRLQLFSLRYLLGSLVAREWGVIF